MTFILKPGTLNFESLKTLLDEKTTLSLDKSAHNAIHASEQIIEKIIEQGDVVYGINTGFGALAHTLIGAKDLSALQHNLIVSHAAGIGKAMSEEVCRLMLALKINSLARGHSGIRLSTIEALIALFNHKIYPLIPEKGSVGASGDLAPLAHLALILLGEGRAFYQGKLISGKEALKLAQLKPLTLAPKEGLALLNGTQASTALALSALIKTEHVFISALIAGACSVEAIQGNLSPFDERIHLVRGHQSQTQVACWIRSLLKDRPTIIPKKVQDPYSIRCQPQVMGACLKQIEYVAEVLITEANAVSDNPLIFADDKTILSGGNFHAEPVALAADALAVSLSEIGALSERRVALLMDPNFSHFSAFAIPNPGLHSGFMIAQVTAAALASENKSLAHPASVDSLPTSANQEDHVSMATFAARRLHDMIENTVNIIAIELLSACQGIDMRELKTIAPTLSRIHQSIRKQVPFYEKDRQVAPDIEKVADLILAGELSRQTTIKL